MKHVKLTNSNNTAIVDDEKFYLVSKCNWQVRKSGYVVTKSKHFASNGKSVRLHRVLTNCPTGEVVDHINGNKLDNRMDNLRVCSIAENTRNQTRGIDKSSKYKGVRKMRNKWVARLYFNKEYVYSATFETEYAAAIAYDLAAKMWFGDFARCNILPHGA
jgi:hypothetical protein